MAYIQLNRLVILAAGVSVYDEKFHQGINIIRGENGVGKSTISNSIYYLLGGDFTKWLPEIEKCDFVVGEVEVNEKIITLRRSITRVSMQPTQVYFAEYETAIKDSNGWVIFPYRRTGKSDSFSQMLFKALDYPEVETADDEYITINQALRLMYIDQTSPLDELMKDIDFDSPLIRKTTADLLLGVYDNSLFTLQILLKDLRKNESQFEAELKLLKAVYNQVDQDVLNRQIREAEEQLVKIDESLKNVESLVVKATDKKANRIAALQDEVGKYSKELKVLLSELSTSQYDVLDTKEFIEELQNQVASLVDSENIRSVLGELKISYCPSCLQTSTLPSIPGHCELCKEPLQSSMAKAQIFRLRQQLEAQIKESRFLLSESETKVEELTNNSKAVQSTLRAKQRALNQLVNDTDSEKRQLQHEMLVTKGKLLQQIEQLQRDLATANKYWSIYNAYQRTKSEISRTTDLIEQKKEAQKNHFQLALQEVNRYALMLLRRDGSYEAAFVGSQMISLDFAKNSYALDGRNNFSASSQVILKNSIRFGIFFASLKLSFMRYPRFILCDNIEDKGMNEGRSRNFQKNLVEIATSAEFANKRFQIIFTTSMVEDSVNIPAYTIGSYYKPPDNKVLVFPKSPKEETDSANSVN
jgi:hypothetical protein